MQRPYFEESYVRDVSYTKSYSAIVEGDVHESSLEDGTSETLQLEY